jgi:hypothetical protein
MSLRRRAFLNLVFAGLILGSLYHIVRDQEHWPFSQYPMFAAVWRAPTFTWLRLFGVTSAGQEFPLDANQYIQPFDQSRLPKAFRRILNAPHRASRLQEALVDCLVRYDELARTGAHDGPSLTGLRLYELEWVIDPAAANLDRPERRQLIAEVRRP